MTTLALARSRPAEINPWVVAAVVVIPTFLVPLAILLHIVSLIQLRRATARLSPGLAHRGVAEAI